jgi:hypothetical protein
MKTITILTMIAIVSAVGMIMSSGIAVSTVHADPAIGKGKACQIPDEGQTKQECIQALPPPGQEKKVEVPGV